ncbi:MAG: hypothetical protein ACRDTU_07840 [Micromonosporaceae bacterium]
MAFTGDEGVAGAWPELPGLPPIGPTGEEPKPGPRLLIPAGAALVLLAGLLAVPWHVRGDSLFTVAGLISDQRARDIGDMYALYLAIPLGVLGALVGFAGATDTRLLRWLQLGAAVLLLGGVGVIGLGVSEALQPYLLGAVALGILASVVLACLKRLPLRVAAAGYLAGGAVVHLGVLASWDAPWLAGLAYLPALGYLVGAAGAAIGPRYVPAFRQL